jgi:2-iminobutanoate/2-iminopropanoate deaminase
MSGHDGIDLASPPGVARATTYEHAARAGDFLFVAGQVARDENNQWVGIDDAGRQAVQVYRNIGRILAHFDLTPSSVVKINTIMTDRRDRDAITAERLKFFGDYRPPHTGIIVAGLGSSEVKVEVEVIAYSPRGR